MHSGPGLLVNKHHRQGLTVPVRARGPARGWLGVTSFSSDFAWRRKSRGSNCCQGRVSSVFGAVREGNFSLFHGLLLLGVLCGTHFSGVCGLVEVQKLIHGSLPYRVYKMGEVPWEGTGQPLGQRGRAPYWWSHISLEVEVPYRMV